MYVELLLPAGSQGFRAFCGYLGEWNKRQWVVVDGSYEIGMGEFCEG